MVLQLQVDSSFRSRKSNFVKMLDSRDIVNFGDVLPDKDIEEILSEVVSASVPCLRVDFTESVELFRLGLLLCSRFL